MKRLLIFAALAWLAYQYMTPRRPVRRAAPLGVNRSLTPDEMPL